MVEAACWAHAWRKLFDVHTAGNAPLATEVVRRIALLYKTERAIRSLALGRNNWLFAGSNAGGTRAAAITLMLETAKLNGIDLQAYLRHVLGTIADHPVNRVAELLPWAITGLATRLDQTRNS